jgi:hypothetical protein
MSGVLARTLFTRRGSLFGRTQMLKPIVASQLYPNTTLSGHNYLIVLPVQHQACRFKNTRIKTKAEREANRALHAPGRPQGPQQAPKYTQAERLAKNKMLAEKEQLLPFKTHGSRAKQLNARRKKPVDAADLDPFEL